MALFESVGKIRMIVKLMYKEKLSMKKSSIQFMLVAAWLVSSIVVVPPVTANSGGESKYAPIMEMIEAGEYQKAIDAGKKALEKKPKNADLLNLVAYSYRKAGQFEPAFEYYFKALEIDPGHRGANEYLGELYLQTNQLPEAEERLLVLDDECFLPCEEYSELKEAIKQYKKDNPA
jgi:tetratricopeptide (TPR) repeat protein